ncbi:MAG: extracellular solute-binding protein, partial [Peptococcaceae bacterium]|nr:extracellular solute-binding protein [Peptococcaceae bacterium]
MRNTFIKTLALMLCFVMLAACGNTNSSSNQPPPTQTQPPPAQPSTPAPSTPAPTTTPDPAPPLSPAPKSIPLTIYTARDEAVYEYVVERFEAEYPQYDVEVIAMGAQQILERVRAESANPQCDFWWGGTQSAFSLASQEGLLQPYVGSFDSLVQKEYKDPNNLWYGEILLPEVIMYNTDALKPEEAPQDWDDLLESQWFDKIIIRGVLPSGTMRTIYCAMMIREGGADPEPGYEWLRKLDKNTKTYSENPTAMYLSLARQEGLISLWNLQDIMIQKVTNEQPFGYIMPKSGAPILVDGVAVVKGAKQAQGAQDLMEFIFREDIRLGLAEETFQI